MPKKELKCEYCGLYLGDMEKGKVRKGTVCLCADCWKKAKAAADVAKMASEGMPDFLNDLFKGGDK